jgi:hypothetical protein
MKREPRMSKEVFEALGHLLQEFGDADLGARLDYFKEEAEHEPEYEEHYNRLFDTWITVTMWFDEYQEAMGTDLVLNMTERKTARLDAEARELEDMKAEGRG